MRPPQVEVEPLGARSRLFRRALLAAERLTRALGGGSGGEIVALVEPGRIAVHGRDGEPQVSLTALEGLVRWFGVHRIVVSGYETSSRLTLELFRAAKVVGVRLSF